MRGAIPHSLNTPPWPGAQFKKKAKLQLHLHLTLRMKKVAPVIMGLYPHVYCTDS
jgi:hypothetical protein